MSALTAEDAGILSCHNIKGRLAQFIDGQRRVNLPPRTRVKVPRRQTWHRVIILPSEGEAHETRVSSPSRAGLVRLRHAQMLGHGATRPRRSVLTRAGQGRLAHASCRPQRSRPQARPQPLVVEISLAASATATSGIT
jgi:hypothetical protein